MNYSIGQVARLARVTVRTLHYYDQVDVLHPSGRSEAGYRRYSLERLQRILCYRQLGFALEQIKAIIGDPATGPLEHLRRQHALLSERIEELQHMLEAVEKIMEARTMGINLEPHEMLEAFGETDPLAYHEEAEQHWGQTDAWTEAGRRSATYTRDDWKRMQAEFATLISDFARALATATPADSLHTMELAEAHRAYLERWFYPCSLQMHCGLADLYIGDPRFAAQFETFTPNLAGYLREAIYANAKRHIHTQIGGS